MGALADPDRLRRVRQDTVAAIDQWVRLAHEVRCELIRLVGDS